MASQYYTVPENFAGKDLSDVRGIYSEPFRPDIVAKMLGVPERGQAFTAGQTVGYTPLEGMGNSAEEQFIKKYFTPGQSPEQKAAQTFAQEQQATLDKSKTEAIGSLEKGRQPLKDRYADVIASIKGTAGQRRAEAGVASAQEFGKRGIPTSSGAYSQYLQQQYQPIDTAEASSLSSTALSQTQEENEIDKAIANIQQSTGLNSVQAAMEMYKIGEQARQFGISQEEAARQFNEQLSFNKSQAQPKQQDERYATIGEGSVLFDLLQGQPLYQAPKIFKASGGGASTNLSDWE